jgi:uncharacterized protein
MKLLTAVFALVLLSALNAENPVRVLIITGGHDFERQPFFEMFDAMSGVACNSVEQPAANALYNTPALKEVDVLVFYDMNQEITEEQKAAFLSMLKQGKGVVFLHHSLASYQAWDEFATIRGGKYVLPELLPESQKEKASTYQHDVEVNVQVVNSQHPVTHGLADFVLHDEVYGNYEVRPNVIPLLRTDHPLSTPVIAWATQYDASKIVYIQPGHDHWSYNNVNYRRLVENAIKWVAK